MNRVEEADVRTRLIAIAVLDLLVLAGGFALGKVDSFGDSAVSWAVAAIGIVTLLGLLAGRDKNTKVTTQFALTVAVAAVWFASVGSLLFFAGDEGPLAGEAFSGISIVMGVVVSFYFGAKAYEAVGTAKAEADATAVSTSASRRSGASRGTPSSGDDPTPTASDAAVEIYD